MKSPDNLGSDDKAGLLQGFLNNTLKEMMTLINAECGSLFLFDDAKKELVLNSFHNAGNLRLEGLRKKIGEGVAGKAFNIKAPILVRDISQDSRFKQNGFRHYRTNSFIAIPLFTSQGNYGLINLADKSTGEPFSEKDFEVVVTVCRYVALTIDNFNNGKSELNSKIQAIEKQKSQLEKYASMGKLAAGVVHEINSPLDGVIRYANLLLEQMDDNSTGREYLLEVKNGLTRITNITKSLLEFSRQVNADTRSIQKYIDLHKLINDSLEFLLKNKPGQNIYIGKRYQENLPEILDLGISHIVINLIKNALDAMHNNGKLEIFTHINNSMVEISFKDDGCGITDEIKNKIFEPFFTTKSIEKGTGLGLSICNEIVHNYEGRIEVDSSAGKGSIFTVLIPKKYFKND